MRWLDGDSEMKFFSKEREVRYDKSSKYREFSLYNVSNGNVFCRLRIYNDFYEIETLDFFNDIKYCLYTLMMRDIEEEEVYSYDRWIQPLLRQKKIEEILK